MKRKSFFSLLAAISMSTVVLTSCVANPVPETPVVDTTPADTTNQDDTGNSDDNNDDKPVDIDLQITISDDKLVPGKTATVTASLEGEDASNTSWTIDNTDILSFDSDSYKANGASVTVHAKKEGSALITAVLGKKANTLTVNVGRNDDEKPTPIQQIKMAQLSDVHVVPRYLVANTEDYYNAQNSDRKLTTESEFILRAKIDQLIAEAPNVLLISGDLTKDGEAESHHLLERELERFQSEVQKKTGTKPQVVLVPGNHDIRNTNGKNFSLATPEQDPSQHPEQKYLTPEYNTKAKLATQTDPWYGQGFKYASKEEANANAAKDGYGREAMGDIYQNAVYSDKNILDYYKDSVFYKQAQDEVAKLHERDPKMNPATVAEANTLSYSVRLTGNHDSASDLKTPGITLICLDSARYSADNTDTQTDEHETSGQVGKYAMQWVLTEAKKAEARGDSVMLTMHHGIVPHFTKEPDVLGMYLVNDYEKIASQFADAGIHYVFTGHMHANDIAEYKDRSGNSVYDIETGSLLTYPTSSRMMNITYQKYETSKRFSLKLESEESKLDADGLKAMNNYVIKVPALDDPTKYYVNDGSEGTTGITDLRLYAHSLQKGLHSEMAVPLMKEVRNTINDEYIGKDENGNYKKLTDYIADFGTKYINTPLTPAFMERIVRAFAGTPSQPLYFVGAPSEDGTNNSTFSVAFDYGAHGNVGFGDKDTYRLNAHLEDIPVLGDKDFTIYFTSDMVSKWLGDLIDGEIQGKLLDATKYADDESKDPFAMLGEDLKSTLLDKYIAISEDGETAFTLTNFANRIYQAHLAGDEDSTAASTPTESMPDPDVDSNTNNGLQPWVKDIVADFALGRDSNVLYGADGVFQTFADNAPDYIYDLFGTIDLFPNNREFLNGIIAAPGSENMWSVAKDIIGNMTSPFEGTRNLIGPMITKAFTKMIGEAQDGKDNLVSKIGDLASAVVLSFAHDDNNAENGITSDLNTTLEADL